MPQTFAPYRFIELSRGSSEKQNQKLYFHVASDCWAIVTHPKRKPVGRQQIQWALQVHQCLRRVHRLVTTTVWLWGVCVYISKCWKYKFYIKISKKSTVFGIKLKPVIKDTECHSAQGSLLRTGKGRINRKGVESTKYLSKREIWLK